MLTKYFEMICNFFLLPFARVLQILSNKIGKVCKFSENVIKIQSKQLQWIRWSGKHNNYRTCTCVDLMPSGNSLCFQNIFSNVRTVLVSCPQYYAHSNKYYRHIKWLSCNSFYCYCANEFIIHCQILQALYNSSMDRSWLWVRMNGYFCVRCIATFSTQFELEVAFKATASSHKESVMKSFIYILFFVGFVWLTKPNIVGWNIGHQYNHEIIQSNYEQLVRTSKNY